MPMSFVDSLNKLLGDPNAKELKKLWPLVKRVRERAEAQDIRSLTLPDLPKKTEEFKEQIQNGKTTDNILTEAFAVVIRACELLKGEKMTMGEQTFVWDMVPFDVQILGGIVLHQGRIAEMKTGEGKTLVCTMPAYLNALTGKGVHVITVNDYLARRDSAWMGLLYEALGLSVGTIIHGKSNAERREAYSADITYGTNNEFGFDYLRDNMVTSKKQQVQRGLHYAIVDEVDSILVDEARTPLIISQPAEESTAKYMQYARLVQQLQENIHYNRDEKQRAAVLSEEGVKKMEELLGVENIYTEKGFAEVHHIEQALRAHAIYQKDVDYVNRDGEIIIVDEFTGRLMPGRRYGHGLHQAIEAKENVPVQRESKTLATITFQNYFRLFEKLAGMTGTAKTEEEEFESIYKLRTIVVPTNKPLARDDRPDAIYRTMKGKFIAVARFAKERHAKGQPVLIGTTSIEKSEALSSLLTKEGIDHEVLNAKNHEREAQIVADAGQKGAVTIATNMAGRGTDIKLGEGVKEVGGLCILGTERHESRRIDNQLRGRAGRQGDPGESLFFVSMDDDLMRLFGGDRIKSMMERLNVPEDQPLQNAMVSRSIEGAQKRIEGRNFDIRKHILQYDDVLNKHRGIIYARRQAILDKLAAADEGEADAEGEKLLHQDILAAMQKEMDQLILVHASDKNPEKWNLQEIKESISTLHPQLLDVVQKDGVLEGEDAEKMQQKLRDLIIAYYELKCKEFDQQTVNIAERIITLKVIDSQWMEHMDAMAHLREQVAFAGYAQRDPLIEYQDQAFRRFQILLTAIDSEIVRTLLQLDFRQFTVPEQLPQEDMSNLQTNADEIEGELTQTGVGNSGGLLVENQIRKERVASPQSMEKVGRNDPCPCGSGKKYKKCHGQEI